MKRLRTIQAAPRPARREGGFTLMEVLLAAGLLALGMSMILGVFNFGSALSRTAELRALSASTVEALVDDLEESLFALEEDGTVGEPRPIRDREVPGRPGVLYSVVATGNPDTVEPGTGLPGEYFVDIEVRWRSAGVKRSASWTTIMLREVPFGARMRQRFLRPATNPTKVETP
ncbi:MAG: hypothetical protein AAGB93_02755 [Planctomycetota bacterium]